MYSGSLVHKRVLVLKKKDKVPDYGTRFPSTGPGSQVRVNYKQFQYIPYESPILGQLLDLISQKHVFRQKMGGAPVYEIIK